MLEGKLIFLGGKVVKNGTKAVLTLMVGGESFKFWTDADSVIKVVPKLKQLQEVNVKFVVTEFKGYPNLQVAEIK